MATGTENNEKETKRASTSRPTLYRLIRRSFAYRWRSNLALALAAALSAGVIAGAMLIGASVKNSLLEIAKLRLGPYRYAATSQGVFPRSAIAAEIADKTGLDISTVLPMGCAISSRNGSNSFPAAEIIGIDAPFAENAGLRIAPGEAAVSENLAEALNLSKGDSIVVEISEKGPSARLEIAWTGRKVKSTPLRLKVGEIISANRFPATFSMESAQTPPMNIFVPLEWLAEKTGERMKGRCSSILARAGNADAPAASLELLEKALEESWTPEDAGLATRLIRAGKNSTFPPRVAVTSDFGFFLPSSAERKLESAENAEMTATYFIDRIERDGRSCPYSFIAGVEGETAKAILKTTESPHLERVPENGIVVTRWLADDLGVNIGDKLEIAFRVPGRLGTLTPKNATMKVVGIVPTGTGSSNPALEPHYPGLTDADNCSEWKPGKIIDLKKIREKDEAYWNSFKATPKAFIALETARKLWKNDFGFATAAILPSESALNKLISTGDLGISFRDVASTAMENAENAVDFAGLFLALSCFAVAAGVLLASALFALSIESRQNEIETKRRLGFSKSEIRVQLLLEAGTSAAIGAAAGVFLGYVYNSAVIAALNSKWLGAVGTPFLHPAWAPEKALIGAGIGLAASIAAISLREIPFATPNEPQQGLKRGNRAATILSGIALFASAAAVVAVALIGKLSQSTAFFIAGALALPGMWCLAATAIFSAAGREKGIKRLSGANGLHAGLAELALRNAARAPRRSMTSIILPSCGVFLVVAVAMNRRTPEDLSKNSSGVGGYEIFAETALPITVDMNSESGRESLGLTSLPETARFLQCPLARGDDASCLNLNRVTRPAVIGVDPAELAEKNAFSFAKTADRIQTKHGESPWSLLEDAANDSIQCVADDEVATWSLKKKIGDKINLGDASNVTATLAGTLQPSVFQGFVLISDNDFERAFPEQVGVRVLLIDIPRERVAETTKLLREKLARFGGVVETTKARLERFRQVENTYLSIFLSLGGLGLAIGALGFGIMAAGNALERREEFALLAAIGFRRGDAKKLFLLENAFLAAAGCAIGTIAAAVAAAPAMLGSGRPLPYTAAIATPFAIFACAIVSILLAQTNLKKQNYPGKTKNN